MTEISASILPTDDTGDGVSGTIWNRAYEIAYKAAIDALIHSATNPTITPKDIIDEVKTARGNLASLNARIGTVITADGELNPVYGVVEFSPFAATVTAGNEIDAAVKSDFNIPNEGDVIEFQSHGTFAPTATNKDIELHVEGNIYNIIPAAVYNGTPWTITLTYVSGNGYRRGIATGRVNGAVVAELPIAITPASMLTDFEIKLLMDAGAPNEVYFLFGLYKVTRAA